MIIKKTPLEVEKLELSKLIDINSSIKELNKNIISLNRNNKRAQVILRSLLTGLFSALGATIGLGICILLLGQFFRGIQTIPFIDTILQQTQLDKIIEYQLELLNPGPKSQEPNNVEVTGTPTLSPTQELKMN